MTNSVLPRWLRHVTRLGRARDEISEELAFHLVMEAERLEAKGVETLEARRIALESFGDLEAIEKECLRIRGGLVEDVACEVRSAFRCLSRDRRLASTAFAGLTAAMALLAVTFSVYESAVLAPLPYSSGQRVMRLWSSVPGIGPDEKWGLAKAQFQFIERESRSFSAMGLYRFETVVARATAAGQQSSVTAVTMSAGTLDVLGVRPLLGRGLRPRDNLPETPGVALISYNLWEDLYNRDPRVLNRTIDVDGAVARIVGVLPRGVSFPEEIAEPDFSAPAVLVPARLNPGDPPENHHVFRALGLLAPGVHASDAEAELHRLVARLPDELPAAYPTAFMQKTGFSMLLIPLAKEMGRDFAKPFILMLAAAALLMALACAAAWSVPVRAPLVRMTPLASEMVLLVACAAAAALVVASLVLRVAPSLEQILPRHAGATLTVRAAGFALLPGAIAAAMLAGFRDGLSKSSSQSSRDVLTLVQVAIAGCLLILSGMLGRRVSELKATSPGFDTADAVAMTIHLPATGYSSHEAVADFHRQLGQKLGSIEGLDVAGMASAIPLTGYDGCSAVSVDSNLGGRCVPVYFVTPGYLKALGVEVRGREVKSIDEPAAVVSASFARRTWPGVDPIGRMLRLGPSAGSYRVVGVAEDVSSRGLDQPPRDDVYVPITPITGWNGWPAITDMTVVIRAAEADPRLVAARVQAAIHSLDGSVETEPAQPLAGIVAAKISRDVFLFWFIAATALIAVLLSASSLQGSLSRTTGLVPVRTHPPRPAFFQ